MTTLDERVTAVEGKVSIALRLRLHAFHHDEVDAQISTQLDQ